MQRLLLLVFFVAALGEAAPSWAEPEPPVKVFSKLDGRWRGTFVGYDPSGKELYRIRVEQTYRTLDDHRQSVEIRDTDVATQKTITGKGENIAHRRPDGTLELRCVVTKSNGEHVEHRGRRIRGALGDEQLIWFSQSDHRRAKGAPSEGKPKSGGDRSETFREAVRKEGDTWVYTIDGMGRYGGTLILMHGRYERVP